MQTATFARTQNARRYVMMYGGAAFSLNWGVPATRIAPVYARAAGITYTRR